MDFLLTHFRYTKILQIRRFASLLKMSVDTVRQNSSTNSETAKLQTSKGNVESDSNVIQLEESAAIDTRPFTVVKEGKAEVLFPSSHDVFYNPVQEFNRDLTVAVIKQFLNTIPTMTDGIYEKLRTKKKMLNLEDFDIRVLEALSASGLRSIRYAKEVKGLNKIIANDRDNQAYESILRNISHNGVGDIVAAEHEDAVLLMYRNKKKFDIVDIDPYGTPAPFLDSAVQAVVDGGLLMVTCTDVAILCGNGIEACHAKYGAVSMKIPCCHEMALRIVLQSIESNANKYGRYIKPVLSISADFYIRIFVQLFTSPQAVKDSVRKLSMVYVCQGCHSFHLQTLGCLAPARGTKYSPSSGPPVNMKCDLCSHGFKVCGPIWSYNLHNKPFVSNLIGIIEKEQEQYGTSKRMLGMLNLVLEELDDCPLFHTIPELCKTVYTTCPSSVEFRSAVLNAGYRVSFSHVSPVSVKTDAPMNIVWDIVREWAKSHAGKKTFGLEPAKTIMSKESSHEVSFTLRDDANPESRASGLLRFQINPEPYWGPKSRSKTSLFSDHEKSKQTRFQGKRKNKVKNGDVDVSAQKKVKMDEKDELSPSPDEKELTVTRSTET